MATDKKTIKAYNSFAEQWAKQIRSGKNVSHSFLEKPAMHKKLPSLKNKTVLCLGCGTGEECKYLSSLKTKNVIGIDISKNLIEYAKQSYPHLTFNVMSMEKLTFPARTFDFVYSSLALHYVKDWTKTLKSVHRILKPNGIFLFSTHHPIRWGAQNIKDKKMSTLLMGYKANHAKGEVEIFGDYLNTRKIKDRWFNALDVTYYHKPLSEIFREIREAGFEIIDFVEPKALQGMKKTQPLGYKIHQKIPMFMILELRKVN